MLEWMSLIGCVYIDYLLFLNMVVFIDFEFFLF